MTHLTFLSPSHGATPSPEPVSVPAWFRGGRGIVVPLRMSTHGVSTDGAMAPCRVLRPAPRPRCPRGTFAVRTALRAHSPGRWVGFSHCLFPYVQTRSSGRTPALVLPAGDVSPCMVTAGVRVAPHHRPWPDLPAVRTPALYRCPGRDPTFASSHLGPGRLSSSGRSPMVSLWALCCWVVSRLRGAPHAARRAQSPEPSRGGPSWGRHVCASHR